MDENTWAVYDETLHEKVARAPEQDRKRKDRRNLRDRMRRGGTTRSCVECGASIPYGEDQTAGRYKARCDACDGASPGARISAIRKRGYTRQRRKPRTWSRRAVYMAKNRAKAKRLPFDLTPEWVEERLSRGVCEVSGLPFELGSFGRKHPYAPSLDRIDSTKGYTPDNCRVVLWAVNAGLMEWGLGAALPIWEAVIRKSKEAGDGLQD